MEIPRRFIGLVLSVFLLGLTACQPAAKLPMLGRAPAWKLKDLEDRKSVV